MLSALVALFLIASVGAETNVTIDDMDPRVVYQPQSVWSFQGNTVATQDRLNRTTHWTAELGATASLTFTGAIAVYFVGYAMKGASPPAFIPITLLPWHGSPVTVQSDAYRPAEAPGQTVLFSSNRLDPSEVYTITVTKTNATLASDLNVDSFILTMPDGADSILSLPAQTTVIDGTTPGGPFVSLGVPGTSTTTGHFPTQPTSFVNTDSSNTSNMGTIAGAIAGGVIGGLTIGVTIAFLAFRWRSKRNQQKQWTSGSDPDGVPIPLYTDNTPRPAYLGAAPPYSSESAVPVVTDHHSAPSALVSTSPLNPVPGQISVNGGTEMAQAQRTLSSTPQIQAKTRYMGNRQPDPFVSVPTSSAHGMPPSPVGTDDRETMLPAYS